MDTFKTKLLHMWKMAVYIIYCQILTRYASLESLNLRKFQNIELKLK
jgi:hypothetical protein